MPLTKPFAVAGSHKQKQAAPQSKVLAGAGLTWKDWMPKRITAEDAEAEPQTSRLFS